ncbi:hypothetical protein J3D61_005468 [Bacillus cereus]|jgi:hypothetical protein|nr:hypothetical protein [Bacillus cereus]
MWKNTIRSISLNLSLKNPDMKDELTEVQKKITI